MRGNIKEGTQQVVVNTEQQEKQTQTIVKHELELESYHWSITDLMRVKEMKYIMNYEGRE